MFRGLEYRKFRWRKHVSHKRWVFVQRLFITDCLGVDHYFFFLHCILEFTYLLSIFTCCPAAVNSWIPPSCDKIVCTISFGFGWWSSFVWTWNYNNWRRGFRKVYMFRLFFILFFPAYKSWTILISLNDKLSF